MTPRRPIKIGLLWHSPNSGNLGVGALTIANMAIVRQVAEGMGLEPEFVILGMGDKGATYLRPGEAQTALINGRFMLKPSGYWRTVGGLDCVLDIGGGDSFTDIYGVRRFIYLWLSKMMAIVRHVPLLLSPQTIGPFSRQPQTALAQMALRGASAVVVRDTPSLEAMAKLAPKVRTVLSTDVAFGLPFTDRSSERRDGVVRVGVNASGLLFNEGSNKTTGFGLGVDYSTLTRQFIEHALSLKGVEVHLITHVTTPNRADDDGWVADLLAKEYPKTIRVPDFAGPSEAKSYISGLDFLVSGRMHACIGAMSSLTAVVPIAYSRKFRGVLGSLGYSWLIDNEGWDTERALAFLKDRLENRKELAEGAKAAMRRVEPLLDVYRDELRRFFSAVVQR